MIRKSLWILALLVVTALMVAACGATPTPAPAAEKPAAEAPAAEAPAAEEPAAEAPAAEEPAAEAVAGCDDPLGCITVAPGDPIKMAAVQSISGATASLGNDEVRGVEIAIADRGEVAGHPVDLSVEDDGCSAEGGQTASTKLASNPDIVGVVGHTCSSSCTPATAIYNDAGLTMISGSCTAPALTAPDTHKPSFLRTAHNDNVQGRVMAEFAYNDLGIRKAATIHDGSPYAEQLQQVFADVFKALGGEITTQEALNAGDTDMRPLLTAIATTQPELIYYPIFIAEGGFVTSQAKEIAGLGEVILAGADGMYSPDFLSAAGEAAEGMFISSPDLAFVGDKYKNFVTQYNEKYGEDPLSVYHAHAYDGATMIFDAIEKVAKTDAEGNTLIGRQALRDALYATKDFEGITGKLTCTENGDCANPKIAVYQVQGGEFVPFKAGESEAAAEVVAGCDDPLGCVTIAADEPLKLASALVIAGPNAALGQDSQYGVEVAIKDRGEVAGHSVELLAEDDGCSAEGGQTAATKIAADEKVVGVVGHSCSSSCTPAATIYNDAGLSMISPSCTAPALTGESSHVASFLRTAHNDNVQGRVMAEYVFNVLGLKKAATIHDGSPYAEQLQQVFADTFVELGGEVTAQEAVNVGDTDMRPVRPSIAPANRNFYTTPFSPPKGPSLPPRPKKWAGWKIPFWPGPMA
jgi:branched-chain amino acid transport system substrate-binding protein